MDTKILTKAGLNESQAKGYIALIDNGQLTAHELADITGESRTNAYAIADKLVAYGLVTKSTGGRAALYAANHPSSVEALAERRRKGMAQNEKVVKDNINQLIDYFYQHTELPGARTLQGVDGIKTVFEDVLRTKKDVFLIRTTHDIPTIGEEFLNNYRKKRKDLGIKTTALTPISEHAIKAIKDNLDKNMLFERIFYPNERYSAPVEIQIYGTKLAMIAYGKTQMATIIDSAPIAMAMQQLCELLAQLLAPYSDEKKREILEP